MADSDPDADSDAGSGPAFGSDRSASAGPSSWVSDRTGLTVLAVVSALLGLSIILPYLQYVLLGVVLAYVLMPAQRRLEAHVPSMIAALVLVAVAILAIIFPLAYVFAIALDEALDIVSGIQNGDLDVGALESRLESTGYSVDITELYETYQEPIATGLQGLATSGIELVSGLPSVLIGLTVTVFVLFALLRDGSALVAWTQRVLPIDDDIQRELYRGLDELMWASVVGNVAVAAIQAIALGVGLAVLGVPAVVFLTVMTFVLALLPLIGAFGVWIPVTLYLIAMGQFVPAAALVVYGSLVSASDTYLRPALIGRTSAFNSAIVVVGIFGGLVVFGAVGLFIGPVVLGGAKLTLDTFARERAGNGGPLEDSERAADPAVDTSDAGIAEPEPDAGEGPDRDGHANGADPGSATDTGVETPPDSSAAVDSSGESEADTTADEAHADRDTGPDSDGTSGPTGDESTRDR